MPGHTMNRWPLRLLVSGVVGVASRLALPQPALAQNAITPDATLGGEASQVVPFDPLNDLIVGGALRGTNLFHSFEQFSIGEGFAAYFVAPTADTANIFARVTGGSPSEILGLLGTVQVDFSPSAATLFLLNPNGILFGPGASLDIGGSFVATTADAIQFGDQGIFSVTDTAAPPLLTVNPSALWFAQTILQGITNRSIAPAGTSPGGIDLTGLAVAPNRSLLLVGGDIAMDGGRIVGSGSRIELGGLAAPGIVNLEPEDTGFSLRFSDQAPLSNVTLNNDGLIGLIGSEGGDIIVHADVLSATLGGRLVASIEGQNDGGSITVNARDINFSGVGFGGTSSGILSLVVSNATGNAGEINIQTESLRIRDGAVISSQTFGLGNAGDITISANLVEVFDFSPITQRLSAIESISLLAFPGSVTEGSSGNITIEADILRVGGGARISTETQSQGQGGNLTITARESTDLVGSGNLITGVNSSGLSTQTAGSGNAGLLRLETGQLMVQDGAGIDASTFGGSGSAGNLEITADSIRLAGIRSDRRFASSIRSISGVSPDLIPATGNAGNISITTRLLAVEDGGSIETSTFGLGQGGTLTINATEATYLMGSGSLVSGVASSGLFTEASGSGNAGQLRLETGQLILQDGAGISASTFGASERAGTIDILADSIRLAGIRSDRQFASAIRSISGVNFDSVAATGNAGNVNIATRLLAVEDGGAIQTLTAGPGRGGNLIVNATETVELIGSGSLTSGVESSRLSTGTISSGDAGFLRLSTGQLIVRDGATVNASTFGGSGSAGDLNITVDSMVVSGIRTDRQIVSTIGSTSELGATGNAGDVSITTRLLTVEDGGSIQTSTAGSGGGGDLTINATETVNLIGSATLASGVNSSGLYTGTTSSGNGGRLSLVTGQLILQEGATVNASTFGGSGVGGDINITADSVIMSGIRADGQFASTIGSTSDISSNLVPATGNAGNVDITTRLLTVQDGGTIATATVGLGQGGNLTIHATEAINLIGSGSLVFGASGSGLSTQTTGSGNAGNLRLETGQLAIQDGASISTSTFGGSGSAGNLTIDADSIRLIGVRADGQFPSSIQSIAGLNFSFIPSTGNAGNLSINTRLLTVEDGGSIQTTTSGPGRGGTLTITATESVELTGTGLFITGSFGSSLLTGTIGSGNAGLLNLQTEQLRLRDGGTISTRSESAGRAGDISLAANRVEMVNGTIETDAPFSQGGNIRIDVSRNGSTGLITLRGDSDITTNSFGNGGNITLNGIVIAFDDSDILARSEDAAGGNITLGPFFSDTLPVGAVLPTEGNDRVDVSAAGRIADGNITLPNLNFIENSLASLQGVTMDPTTLTAGSCIARSPDDRASFVVTGSGGLPVRPGDNVISAYPTGSVQALPGSPPQALWQPGDPIVEPTGVFALPNGRLVLARACDDE